MEQPPRDNIIFYNKDLINSLSENGGLATIQKIVDGDIHPGGLCETLKIKFEKVEHGHMTMSCQYDPALHSNPFGIANGGWHGAMLDNAAGYAGLSLAEAGYGGFTKEMTNLRFYRTVVNGLFHAYGEVIERQEHRILCSGRIVDEHNEVYAESNLLLSIRGIDEIRATFEAMGIQIQ